MITIESTILFLSKASDNQYINYLGRVHEKRYIVEYIASYYYLILKKMNYFGLLQFFEQDGHSFEPYTNNDAYPYCLNDDTEAFELFIQTLLYSSRMNSFKNNKNLIIIYNFFANLCFKIEKEENTVFCDFCKISVINDCHVCTSCQTYIKQDNIHYYLSKKMKKNILENQRYFYQNMDFFNKTISDFVYFNLKEYNPELEKYYNQINYVKKLSDF